MQKYKLYVDCEDDESYSLVVEGKNIPREKETVSLLRCVRENGEEFWRREVVKIKSVEYTVTHSEERKIKAPDGTKLEVWVEDKLPILESDRIKIDNQNK